MAQSIIQVVLQRYWRWSRGLLLSVAAAVTDGEGRVLLCRDPSSASNHWRLPRGDVLAGEDVEATVQRVLESGGLPAVCGRASPFAIYADPEGSQADHVILLTARVSASQIAPPSGALEWRWFEMAALPDVIDPPSRRRIEELSGLREVVAFW